MSGTDGFSAGIGQKEADRLFKETAARQAPRGDGRLLPWLKTPKPGSNAEIIGSMLSTAFGVFCIVGGLAMMLGMAFVPAAGVSLAVFAMVRVFMAMV